MNKKMSKKISKKKKVMRVNPKMKRQIKYLLKIKKKKSQIRFQ